MVSILIVEDHMLLREAWKDVISGIGNFVVVGEADNTTDAYEKIVQLRPSIIMVDINLRGENGVELISRICHTIAHPKIIVVSMNDEYSFIKKMFSIGIKGYVTKFSPKSDLVEALKTVSKGENFMCSETRKIFLQKTINPGKEDKMFLSYRELDIIKFISKGLSNKEIAGELDLSVKTVEGHKTKIYRKLNVRSVAELITYARAKGLDF